MGGAILLLGKNDNITRQNTGQTTLMAGLCVNLASFCLFFTLIIWFEVATRRIVKGRKRSYTPIVWAAMFSQLFLIGRSIYRVIEFQQGYFSPIATVEIYFYFFDTLFMILATSVYIPFFPPAFGLLGKKRLAMKLQDGSLEMDRPRGEVLNDHQEEGEMTSRM
jgi:RTA1 like protein